MKTEMKLDFNERSDGSPDWTKSVFAELDVNALWRYPDRSVFERKLALFERCNPDNILATNGGDEGIDLVMRWAKTNDLRLLLPLPAFSMYRITAARNQLPVIEVSAMTGQRIDYVSVKKSITAKQLIAITSPNNPNGELIDDCILKEIIEIANDAGSYVLIDAAYADFVPDYTRKISSLSKEFDNSIVLRSFSKAYGLAGLRIGFLQATPSLMTMIRFYCAPFNLSTPSLVLAEKALSTVAQQDKINYIEHIGRNREHIRQQLQKWDITTPISSGNFIFLQLTKNRAELLFNVLKQNAIAVRNFKDDELADCLRITVPLKIDHLINILAMVFDPELLCLDMDGVLIDTSASYDNCVKATYNYFSSRQLNQITLQNKRNEGGCNDDWSLTQKLLHDAGLNIPYEAIKQRFQMFYEGENGFEKNEIVVIRQSTAELLRQYISAVVTGRPQNEAKKGCQRLPWSVDAVISRDDVRELKPSPEGINAVKSQFNCQRCWMLGDSVDDMGAALGAGAVAIGIGIHNAAALYQAGAHLVIDSINELESLL